MPPLEEEPEAPVYARCSAGIGKWYWVVWESWSEAKAGGPASACGFQKNAVSAEAKAIESAGAGARPIDSKWASRYQRGGSAATRPARERTPKRDAGPARTEFLYCAYESDESDSPGQVVVEKHRIVKQNPRKIYVESEPFREDPPESTSEGVRAPRMLIIDRATLKQDGRHRHPRSHRLMHFYASREQGIGDVEAMRESELSWCATLGVGLRCSVEDVKAAYRRLAKESHPDAGGDPDGFRRVEQAYRDALAYFDRTDAAT